MKELPAKILETIRAGENPDLADISSLISDKLVKVESLFSAMLTSKVGIINSIGRYLSNSGGKRIRPLVHLLCARMCGHEEDRDVVFATIFESIHTATLVHDDIIDNARTRRGRSTVNRKWGNTITVLLGDYLFTKSISHAIQDGDLRIINKLAEITLQMIEGELMQEDTNGKADLAESEYIEIAKGKTAALFAGCTSVAGMISSVSEEKIHALDDFGMNFGIAFQLVDDLLDFTADEKVLGKPVASDLKEGRLTLPLIYLLRIGVPEHRDLVLSVLNDEEENQGLVDEIVKIVKENGVIRKAREKVLDHAAKAKSSLSIFKDSLYKNALMDLTDLIVFRNK